MAVKNRLAALMGEKQVRTNEIVNVATVAAGTGLSRQTIYSWLDNKVERFDAPTISAFCRYFKCGVGDLLVFEEGTEVEPEPG